MDDRARGSDVEPAYDHLLPEWLRRQWPSSIDAWLRFAGTTLIFIAMLETVLYLTSAVLTPWAYNSIVGTVDFSLEQGALYSLVLLTGLLLLTYSVAGSNSTSGSFLRAISNLAIVAATALAATQAVGAADNVFQFLEPPALRFSPFRDVITALVIVGAGEKLVSALLAAAAAAIAIWLRRWLARGQVSSRNPVVLSIATGLLATVIVFSTISMGVNRVRTPSDTQPEPSVPSQPVITPLPESSPAP